VIRVRTLLLAGAVCAALPAAPAFAASPDFALGQNGENQACRAQAHYGSDLGQQVDVFCGEWDRPSGVATLLPLTQRAQAEALLAHDCAGDAKALTSASFTEMRQIGCTAQGADGLRRYGLMAVRGKWIVVGRSFPADWAPLVKAAEVLSGALTPTAAASTAADSAGLREIQAVFPEGPPGQAAAFNYELLRRRAYEKNAIWNFGGSQKDFAELLAAHRAISPTDIVGEAEIMAEVGLNLSGEQRFDEAGATLRQAETKAVAGGDLLLASKIANYRAIDLMNQRRYAEAITEAMAANEARAKLMRATNSAGQFSITAADADAGENSRRRKALLIQMGDPSPAERAATLSAQASYLAGAASISLGRADADRYLDQADAQLATVPNAAPWLKAMIAETRAQARLLRGDARGAAAIAAQGLATIRAFAPGTRSEAHLLLVLAKAQRAGGAADQALASGRAAVTIFAAQKESPGLPPDLAADHLDGLLAAWTSSHDAALASEFFQTSSLTWDGAAARSALQLAARLGDKEASGAARTYQDAERSYRAALARREKLALAPDVKPEQKAAADAKVQAAAGDLSKAEGALRAASPRYLELLSPTVSAADMTSVLAPDEAYLRIIIAPDASYGVLVTPAGVTPYRIALSEAEIGKLADKLRTSSRMGSRRLPDYDLVTAAALYQQLFAPVQDGLKDVKRLQIDTGGALAALPMAALLTAPPTPEQLKAVKSDQDYSGVAWLARSYAVAQSVGPAPFVRMRRNQTAPTSDKGIIFGDFQPNPKVVAERLAAVRNLSPQCEEEVRKALARLEALPETASEAQQTAALFGGKASIHLGADFTDEQFMSDPVVGDAEVLVLATHGVLGLSSCFAEPALIATVGATGDGLIEASELLDRRLHARLVVLSACDTAGGGRSDVALTGLSDGGEALSGLARGFLYAGASSVMATQWKVDSTASAAEVKVFFQQALGGGKSMSVSLNQAQAALYGSSETGHPFYWAGFTLIGDGGATLSATTTKEASK
jgi:CHAT domain-containing protein